MAKASSVAVKKRHPLQPGDPMYCIFRIEPSVHGPGGYWQVSCRRVGRQYNVSFFDRAYQGPEHALNVAQTFRDALLERLPSLTLLRVIRERKTASGIKGISRLTHVGQVYWRAKLNVEGKMFCRLFRISEYGEEGARQRAIETRAAWLKELGLDRVPQLPSQQEVHQLAKEIGMRFGEKKTTKLTPHPAFNKEDMYGISRREADASDKGGYWKVCVSRRGILYAKNFYDGTEGGKEKAFIAASRYRDDILINTKPLTLQERHQLIRCDNTSGVTGVRLIKKNGVPHTWQARIRLEGKEKSKNFSIDQYGHQRAFELAVETRQELLKQVKEGFFVYSSVAKKWHSNRKPEE